MTDLLMPMACFLRELNALHFVLVFHFVFHSRVRNLIAEKLPTFLRPENHTIKPFSFSMGSKWAWSGSWGYSKHIHIKKQEVYKFYFDIFILCLTVF